MSESEPTSEFPTSLNLLFYHILMKIARGYRGFFQRHHFYEPVDKQKSL